MAGSATAKIAEKLAARQAANGAAKPKVVAEPEPETDEATDEAVDAEEVNDDLPVIDEDDDLLPEEAPKRGTLAQKQAAAKAAKTEPAKPAKTKAAPAAKGKKPASPAQIAAREAFAAKSRERAAAAAAAKGEAAETPVQTETDVKAKQVADRKAANAARATAATPKREPTSKPVQVKAPKAAAPAVKAKATKTAKATGSKAADKVPSERSLTGDKVRALAAKGKTRREIMDELELSYASVFYHTRGVDMSEGSRGKVFVDTNLDAEGKKLRGSKTETVSRSEAMRRDYLNGMEVGDIARKYEVRYQIAYTACRNILNKAAADDE